MTPFHNLSSKFKIAKTIFCYFGYMKKSFFCEFSKNSQLNIKEIRIIVLFHDAWSSGNTNRKINPSVNPLLTPKGTFCKDLPFGVHLPFVAYPPV